MCLSAIYNSVVVYRYRRVKLVGRYKQKLNIFVVNCFNKQKQTRAVSSLFSATLQISFLWETLRGVSICLKYTLFITSCYTVVVNVSRRKKTLNPSEQDLKMQWEIHFLTLLDMNQEVQNRIWKHFSHKVLYNYYSKFFLERFGLYWTKLKNGLPNVFSNLAQKGLRGFFRSQVTLPFKLGS